VKRIALMLGLLVAPTMASGGSLERGVKALEAGRPRVARIEFMNAIKAAPNRPEPHLMQARTFLLLEDGVAAEAEVRRARSLGAAAGDTRHLLAEALLLQGDGERALAAVTDGPSHFPAAAEHAQGRALAALGRPAEAARAFGEALLLAPNDPRLWLNLARFRLQTGERAGAIAAADRALQIAPGSVRGIVLRGTLVRDQYGLKAALPWFDRALAIDPDDVSAMLERAATLGELGRYRTMLAATRKVLALRPGNGQARYLQAVLAARARNFDLARTLHQKTSASLAASPSSLLLGAIIDVHGGNDEQAIGRLETLYAAQPGNLAVRRLMGLAQLRKGDAASAIAALRPLDTRARTDSYALTLLAAAHARSGDKERARRALELAASPASGSGLLTPDLGRALQGAAYNGAAGARYDLANGNAGGALAAARQIQAQSAGAPEAHLMAGDMLFLTGNMAGAASAFREAANLTFNQPIALRLVEALQQSGNGEAARATLALFLDQNPRSLPALLLLGNMRVAARDWDGAIVAYESVRSRTGDHDAALLNNLAWANFERGGKPQALAHAKRAYRIAPGNSATQDAYGWMMLNNGGERATAMSLLHRAWLAR